jgi:hypothetical protein
MTNPHPIAPAGTCANCGTALRGTFCHACGQRGEIHPLTLPHLLHEIPHAIFHVDRGLLLTIRALALRPGRAINAYLDGHRIRYFNPLSMLVLLAGVCALAYAKFPFDYSPLTTGLPPEEAVKTAAFMQTMMANYSFGLMVQLPVVALLSWWILGRHRGYGEHLALNAFIFAFMCVINLASIPVQMLTNGGPWMPSTLFASGTLFVVYQVFALWDTFRTPGRWFAPLVRACLTAGLYVLIPVLVGVVAGAVMAMHAAAKP